MIALAIGMNILSPSELGGESGTKRVTAERMLGRCKVLIAMTQTKYRRNNAV